MHTDIRAYNTALSSTDKAICTVLAQEIERGLPDAESKIWHRHPVWFLNGNPIVGYSKLKAGVRLMFWSGADFKEKELQPGTGKFKDASMLYTGVEEIQVDDLQRWLKKAKKIQWDYKNIVKRKGVLRRMAVKGVR